MFHQLYISCITLLLDAYEADEESKRTQRKIIKVVKKVSTQVKDIERGHRKEQDVQAGSECQYTQPLYTVQY